MRLCQGIKDSSRDVFIIKKGLLFDHLDILDNDNEGRREGVENYLNCLRSSKAKIVRLLIVPRGEEEEFEEQLQDAPKRDRCQKLYGKDVQVYWVYESNMKRDLPSECAMFDCEVVVLWQQRKRRLKIQKAHIAHDVRHIHSEIMNCNSIYNQLQFPDEYR